MSGVEILGIVASASQLVSCSFKIVESITTIYERVQDAPERIKRNIDQVQQLIKTTELIKQSQRLHTSNIHDHIKAILTEAHKLNRILEQVAGDQKSVRRTWNHLTGKQEKIILTTFEKLEKEKSALTLSITFVHTDLLYGIQSGVDDIIARTLSMAEKSGQCNVTVKMESSTESISSAVDANNRQIKAQPHSSLWCMSTQKQLQIEAPPTQEAGQVAKPAASPGSLKDAKTLSPKSTPDATSNRSWKDVKSTGKSSQVNGNVGEVVTGSGTQTWTKIVAEEQSNQVNGDVKDGKGIFYSR